MKSNIISAVGWAAWFVAAFLIFSSPAWAWGPGTHIETSRFLLTHLVLLAPFIRKLISSHPAEFIYGAIVPDMVLGKRYMRPERNNHQWKVGFDVLLSAGSSKQRAFGLGYLSHLAADTVAHNQFVPDLLLARFDVRRRGHVTHELLFDAMLDDEVWTICAALSRRSYHECDRLLRQKLPRTPIPKRINHRIFRSGGVLVRSGGWEKIVRQIRARWGHELESRVVTPYLHQVHETVLEFLNDPDQAACRGYCPTGGKVLHEAESLRRDLKLLNKQSLLQPDDYQGLITDFTRWRENTGTLILEPKTFS